MKNQKDYPISGYYLENHKWEKIKQGVWKREVATVTYDGTNWYYNGKQIEDSVLKNPQLKVPSVNPNLPPPGFKDMSDYYSAMMENK